jgi:hypothetical protein
MAESKELRSLLRAAELAGWTVTRSTGTNHWRLADPSGGPLLHVSATPSDGRALRNIRRDLERAGVKV